MSNYRDPRVDPQLQVDFDGKKPATRGSDCSPRVVQGLIRWAKRGRKVLIRDIRAAVGVNAGGFTVAQALAAYKAFGVTATRTGQLAKVTAALDAGHAVQAAIDYAWVNDNAPRLSGQKSFRKKHSIGAFGRETVIEKTPPAPTWVEWLDPLHDARWVDGVQMPKQIAMARESELIGAMQAFGRIDAIIVERDVDPAA